MPSGELASGRDYGSATSVCIYRPDRTWMHVSVSLNLPALAIVSYPTNNI